MGTFEQKYFKFKVNAPYSNFNGAHPDMFSIKRNFALCT